MYLYVCVCWGGRVFRNLWRERDIREKEADKKRNAFASLPASQWCLVTMRCLELLNPLIWSSDAEQWEGKRLGFWRHCGAGQSTRNCSLDFLLGKTVTLIIKPIFKQGVCYLSIKIILYTTHTHTYTHTCTQSALCTERHLVLKVAKATLIWI